MIVNHKTSKETFSTLDHERNAWRKTGELTGKAKNEFDVKGIEINEHSNILRRAQFKLFSLFCVNNILTIMLSFFYIPMKHISRQVSHMVFHTQTFDIKKAFLSKVDSFLQSHSTIIGLNSDLSLSYIKGCSSINKLHSIDSSLDWEGHHLVFNTFFHPNAQDSFSSPDHSTAIATNKICQNGS